MATVMLTYVDRIEVVDAAPTPSVDADGARRRGQRVTISVAHGQDGGQRPVAGRAMPGGGAYVVLSASGHDLSRHYEPGRLPEGDLMAAFAALGDEEGLLMVTVNGMQVWPEPLDTAL